MHDKVKTSWCFISTEVDVRVLLLFPFSFYGHGTVQGWLGCMFLWGDLRQRRRRWWTESSPSDPNGTMGAGTSHWGTHFSKCHPERGPCPTPVPLASCPSLTSPPFPATFRALAELLTWGQMSLVEWASRGIGYRNQEAGLTSPLLVCFPV